MSRKLVAILVSSALALGNLSTTALAAPEPVSVKNQYPLPAGGAAGIKQAQGQGVEPWAAIAIVAGIFLAGVLLLQAGDDDDDDNGGPSTTGTGG